MPNDSELFDQETINGLAERGNALSGAISGAMRAFELSHIEPMTERIEGLSKDTSERLQEIQRDRALIMAQLAGVRAALEKLKAQAPPNVRDLIERLREVPNDLSRARKNEADARRTVAQVRDNLATTEAMALLGAGDKVAGKNAEERKLKQAGFLADDPECKRDREALTHAEGRLIEAQLELEAAQDRASAVKAEARLVASVLESMLES